MWDRAWEGTSVEQVARRFRRHPAALKGFEFLVLYIRIFCAKNVLEMFSLKHSKHTAVFLTLNSFSLSVSAFNSVLLLCVHCGGRGRSWVGRIESEGKEAYGGLQLLVLITETTTSVFARMVCQSQRCQKQNNSRVGGGICPWHPSSTFVKGKHLGWCLLLTYKNKRFALQKPRFSLSLSLPPPKATTGWA